MFCIQCGAVLDPQSRFCVSCGAPNKAEATEAPAAATGAVQSAAAPAPSLATKTCPYCGEQIAQVAIRCKHCSSNLVPAAASGFQGGISLQGPTLGQGQPSIVIQNVQASQGPTPQFGPRELKNPGVALLLSFVFPGGGQFYNGHGGKGIIVLLTFWLVIPLVWSWFDAYNSAKKINARGY